MSDVAAINKTGRKILIFLQIVELCRGVESRSDVTELTPATGYGVPLFEFSPLISG